VTVQPTLLDVPAAPRPLTSRQAFVWHLVCGIAEGITAEQVGAALHAQKGTHPVGEPCIYCGRDGRAVLTSKAVAPLVTYRVRGDGQRRYIPRDPADRAREPESGQSDELPDDLFGGAA